MFAPREPGEHLRRVGLVPGLAQDVAVQEDERVGREDPRIGAAARHERRLLSGEPRGRVLPGLAGENLLGHVRRVDPERNVHRSEDLRPPRRRRGQNEKGGFVICDW